MNASMQPPRLTIAKPCSARWEDMSGDERARFCGHCQKHVYNLSILTTPQIQALITEREGKFCGRFYQRPDGTMLTADCPVGQERSRRRVKHWIATATAAVTMLLGTLAAWASPQKGRSGKPDEAVKTGQVLAIPESKPSVRPLMGDVCLPALPTNSAKMGEMQASSGTNRPQAIMGKVAMPPATGLQPRMGAVCPVQFAPKPATNAPATNLHPVMGLVCPVPPAPKTNAPPPAPPK